MIMAMSVAYVPAIPGCHAWGQTSDEARAELVYVFEMIQKEYEELGCFQQMGDRTRFNKCDTAL